MFSKREQEGYLLIDHRAGGGISPGDAAAAGHGTLPVGRGMRFESATITCSHCERIVVLNPDRSRGRGYCPKCDHFVCDRCEGLRVQTGECRPFKLIIDELQNRVAKAAG